MRIEESSESSYVKPNRNHIAKKYKLDVQKEAKLFKTFSRSVSYYIEVAV